MADEQEPTPASETDADVETGAVAPMEAQPPAVDAPPAVEVPTVWSRFGAPLVVPVLVALTIIVYVLSISRIFLAGAGSLAVIFATIMTVGILAAATYFANSKMRSSSIGLAVMGSLMTISLLGMVSIGGAEHHEEEEEELPPAVGAIDIVSGNLFFRPSTFAVPVGTIELDVFNEAGTHNITFDDPNLPGGPQPVEMEGTGDYTGEINFPAPGDYTFYCSVPGHRAGGMEGVITADESLTPAPPEGESGETEAGGETPAAG